MAKIQDKIPFTLAVQIFRRSAQPRTRTTNGQHKRETLCAKVVLTSQFSLDGYTDAIFNSHVCLEHLCNRRSVDDDLTYGQRAYRSPLQSKSFPSIPDIFRACPRQRKYRPRTTGPWCARKNSGILAIFSMHFPNGQSNLKHESTSSVSENCRRRDTTSEPRNTTCAVHWTALIPTQNGRTAGTALGCCVPTNAVWRPMAPGPVSVDAILRSAESGLIWVLKESKCCGRELLL